MPRAHRHHLPGHVWHATHRCNDRRFLLRFVRDRRAWVGWLYEARRRYGLCVLDYCVTSNHIQLLVSDQVEQRLKEGRLERQAYWSESLAVGSREFVDRIQRELGPRAHYRGIEASPSGFILHEPSVPYGREGMPENAALSIGIGAC